MRPPSDALVPPAFSVDAAERWALERAAGLPAEPFRLLALWSVTFLLQAEAHERKARYTMRIAQAEGYGRSGGLTPPDPDPDLVGQDARRILRERRCRHDADRTAIVDLVMGQISRPADAQVVVEGTAHRKYLLRTELFADEVEWVTRGRDPRYRKADPPRVLVVGATAGILDALTRRGFAVSATDLSTDVVGQTLGGLPVQDGRTANPRLMEDADVAIVTGLSLTNGTLPDLVSAAKTHNTSTIVWAITGKNFGHYYTEHGVDSVISDPSPFLLLPGPAAIAIWRRQA